MFRKSPYGLLYTAHSGSITPADGSTYYFGASVAVPTTTGMTRCVFFRKAGIIRSVDLTLIVTGTVGTGEAILAYLRLNHSVDYPIPLVSSTNVVRYFADDTLVVPVTKDEFFEFKLVFPAWATNPTAIFCEGKIYAD
jgi:hypothetical protein